MSDKHDIKPEVNSKGKGKELSLDEFAIIAKSHTAHWQFVQISPFVMYVKNSISYQEKAWTRNEYDWWVLFDRFTERENQNMKDGGTL